MLNASRRQLLRAMVLLNANRHQGRTASGGDEDCSVFEESNGSEDEVNSVTSSVEGDTRTL